MLTMPFGVSGLFFIDDSGVAGARSSGVRGEGLNPFANPSLPELGQRAAVAVAALDRYNCL